MDVGERVNQLVARRGGDLKQADFFGIGVQAVSFGIQGDPRGAAQTAQKIGQFYVVIYHWDDCNFKTPSSKEK